MYLEKCKDTLYNKFKATCSQCFDQKRSETKAQDSECGIPIWRPGVAICSGGRWKKRQLTGNSELSKLSDYT
ncbi:MAG: hypothetical protein IPO04_06275 [Cytophagaceae bacterium]|nr:hypothetical protein [Cytophagaceae bacterium]